jgi:hypothetical protein
MLVENSRAYLSGYSGRRGLRSASLRVANASKVSGPGLEHLNADTARCSTTRRSEDAGFGWRTAPFRGIHDKTCDC